MGTRQFGFCAGLWPRASLKEGAAVFLWSEQLCCSPADRFAGHTSSMASSSVTSGMSDMKIGARLRFLAPAPSPLQWRHWLHSESAPTSASTHPACSPFAPAALRFSGDGKGSSSSDSDPLKWVFENEHIIGNGSFGVVYQAVVKNLQKVLAACTLFTSARRAACPRPPLGST